MKGLLFLLAFIFFIKLNTQGQVYYTKNGNISFFSKSPLQNIEADNNQVISVLNTESGAIQFSLLNNAFQFEKAKMQEDFNENYIESSQYPRSTFKGTIINISGVNFEKDGSYNVNVNGDLTIHGQTKSISIPAIIFVKNGNISGKATFNILVKDYKIDIPTIVSKKIGEKVEIKVDCEYQKK